MMPRLRASRSILLVTIVAIAAAAAYIAYGRGAGNGLQAAQTAHKAPPQLAPPGPIPGYMLIADRGNNRMLLVDSKKHIYWRYPSGSAHAMPFVFDDDVFFGPRHDRIISNQEDQDTIQIISFPGKRVLWRYGHVNVKSGAPGYMNTPDDAYLLPNGLVSVADAYNCRVLFISHDHRIVQQYGTTGVCQHNPPRYLGAVNGATPLADGGTLVSEINGSWIDNIGPSGNLRWAVQAPVSYPSDPQLLSPNRILLADYSHPGAAIIMTRTGKVVWRYGPASGPNELDHPSLATRIAPGLIAINDDYRDRVVIVSIRTRRVVWQYGHTDHPGTANGYLNTPDGLDVLPTKAAQANPAVRRLLLRQQLALAPKPVTTTTATTTSANTATSTMSTTTAQPSPVTLHVSAPFQLAAPVQRIVAVAWNGSVLLAGGLDSSSSSTTGVFRFNVSTGRLTALGAVPQAFHDAAGAVLGNALYVFGGGAATSSSAVQRFDLATHTSSIVSHLPRPLSDLAVAQTPNGVYLVGGYDGVAAQPSILRTRDGVHFTRVATLPLGLRYAAVAAVGNTVVIAGGQGSNRVFALDTSSNKLTSLGTLPSVTAGAAGFALNGNVYVAGSSIYRVFPGPITRVGRGVPALYGGTAVVGNSAWIFGGETSPGAPTASVRRVSAGRG